MNYLIVSMVKRFALLWVILSCWANHDVTDVNMWCLRYDIVDGVGYVFSMKQGAESVFEVLDKTVAVACCILKPAYDNTWFHQRYSIPFGPISRRNPSASEWTANFVAP